MYLLCIDWWNKRSKEISRIYHMRMLKFIEKKSYSRWRRSHWDWNESMWYGCWFLYILLLSRLCQSGIVNGKIRRVNLPISSSSSAGLQLHLCQKVHEWSPEGTIDHSHHYLQPVFQLTRKKVYKEFDRVTHQCHLTDSLHFFILHNGFTRIDYRSSSQWTSAPSHGTNHSLLLFIV